MKLIWCSDIHLNFLQNDEKLRNKFYDNIKEANGDAVLITGDVAESHNIVALLSEMEKAICLPIYFVLGNHDFYGSGVAEVKKQVKKLDGWLGQAPIELNDECILIGVDGWGDCRNGDYECSRLTMSDWLYIDELRKGYGQGPVELKKAIQKLADADARKLKRSVLKALEKGYKKIIIATHVPPFKEVCLYAGRKSGPDGLPFFSSRILGDTILPIAKKFPKVNFLWLSGHTHSRVRYSPCNNMKCKVADAEYYFPKIEEVINV